MPQHIVAKHVASLELFGDHLVFPFGVVKLNCLVKLGVEHCPCHTQRVVVAVAV